MKTFLASGLYAAAVSGILTISVQAQTQLTGNASAPAEPLCLWYRQPATHWTQALPIGNGRIGAMIFGGINRETIQLNEDTLWAGGPYDPVNPEARAALPEVRQLIFAGQYKKAASLISARVMSKPLRQMPYETAGDLILTFPDSGTVENYRRQLDLDTAAAGVEYTAGGIRFTRQMFASPVDQVIVVRLTADKKGAISFVAGLDTPQQATVKTEDGNTIVMSGMNGSYEGIPGALRFQARVRVLADGGTIRAITNSVRVSNADSATILIALATSYRNYDDVGGDPEAIVKSQIDAAEAKSFNTLLMGHVRDYQRLFRRVAIDLGRSSSMELPTDER
ncbi:MAG TPA: glycoside hydrolase family 95 protein, partial [Verrucomicrobiae bacterium]|nr:glycoside hydrolase family 95 protein [Verrucomicrobiae bacterium]